MAKKLTRPQRRRKVGAPKKSTPHPPLRSPLAADPPAAELSRDKQIAAAWVRHHEREYLATAWTTYVDGWTGPWSSPPIYRPSATVTVGNPIHVWSAYLECRAADLPLPEWILRYLDRVASRLRRRVSDRAGAGVPPAPRDPAAAVASDLEMLRQGAGQVFEHYLSAPRDELLLAAEVGRRVSHGQRVNEAIRGVLADSQVAGLLRRGPRSFKAVERAWTKYKNKFE